jgi:hypothetical protein
MFGVHFSVLGESVTLQVRSDERLVRSLTCSFHFHMQTRHLLSQNGLCGINELMNLFLTNTTF